jgi:hypothetical protein
VLCAGAPRALPVVILTSRQGAAYDTRAREPPRRTGGDFAAPLPRYGAQYSHHYAPASPNRTRTDRASTPGRCHHIFFGQYALCVPSYSLVWCLAAREYRTCWAPTVRSIPLWALDDDRVAVLQMLDAIQEKLGIEHDADSELADLEMETRPEDVLAEIDRVHRQVKG